MVWTDVKIKYWLYTEIADLQFGVPQGSVLGPVLFIMYITPQSSFIKKSILHEMFADDTQLSTSDIL